MVKGINKRVVVIRPSGKGIFEEAIFILRGDAAQTGCSADDILKEACSIANNYMIGGEKATRYCLYSGADICVCGCSSYCGCLAYIPLMLSLESVCLDKRQRTSQYVSSAL